MTALDLNIYDRTFRGEPIRQAAMPTRLGLPVRPPFLRVLKDGLWTIGDWLVNVPAPAVHPAPDVQLMTRELRQWTGWSARQLAEVLGTSHTTVLAVEAGRPLVSGHSGDLRRRYDDAHSVVSRIHVLSDRDPSRTAHLLSTAPLRGLSASEYLKRRDPANAYLAALDVLRPPTQGLLVGTRPSHPGHDTVPLHD